MSYLRQFVPDVLAAVRFAGGPGTDDLLQAVGDPGRAVRDRGPQGPGRRAGRVRARPLGRLPGDAAKAGDVTAYRHYWELCVLMALRDGLRSGDVYVPGSRRYADPASFLLTPQQWEPQRLEFCHLVGKPADGRRRAGPGRRRAAHRAGGPGDPARRGGGPGEVRLSDDGELIIPPLTAEDVPAEAEALRAELAAMLPRVADRVGAGRDRRPHRVHRPPGARRRQGQPGRRSSSATCCT